MSKLDTLRDEKADKYEEVWMNGGALIKIG
jgi:prolyl-tRNA editing enzyme YbaK/EbsC (Cys-tRNA(Pro) deacylase)